MAYGDLIHDHGALYCLYFIRDNTNIYKCNESICKVGFDTEKLKVVYGDDQLVELGR